MIGLLIKFILWDPTKPKKKEEKIIIFSFLNKCKNL